MRCDLREVLGEVLGEKCGERSVGRLRRKEIVVGR